MVPLRLILFLHCGSKRLVLFIHFINFTCLKTESLVYLINYEST